MIGFVPGGEGEAALGAFNTHREPLRGPEVDDHSNTRKTIRSKLTIIIITFQRNLILCSIFFM